MSLCLLIGISSRYYSDGFWDGPAQEPSDAAIRINYCHNVRVEGCNFVGGLTGYGVAIGNTSTQISVTGSLFDSVGQGGVAAYGFDGKGTIPGTGGRQAGNNSQPSYLTVYELNLYIYIWFIFILASAYLRTRNVMLL